MNPATPTNFGIPPGLASAGTTASVPVTRRINTVSPLLGGGDLTSDLTLSISSIVLSGELPVDAIFITLDPTNPSITLGYGTWVPFGHGQVLVGA